MTTLETDTPRRHLNRRLLVFLAICLVIGVIIFANDSRQRDDTPERLLTPTEAACSMLADGDTPVEAFDILVDQGVSELAASRAVNTATNQGC